MLLEKKTENGGGGSRSIHFLVATFPLHGHINPCRQLAHRLASLAGASVTFCTSISVHSQMFPAVSSPGEEVQEGLVTYIPFSDGYDGSWEETGYADPFGFWATYKATGAKNLAAVIDTLAGRGRAVTCVIYTILLPWVASVARACGVPSVHFWIQPTTVFAAYYHYFHGYEDAITEKRGERDHTVVLPGLPPMRIRDLPSFLTITDPSDASIAEVSIFRELFETLDNEKTTVLLNTLDALEPEAIAAISDLHLIPVGPLPHVNRGGGGDLTWLDSKPPGSVVYVSFGSITKQSKVQLKEISRGLAESRRPFLWVVRKGNMDEEGMVIEELVGKEMEGMVVEWCSQPEVLSHPAVGCFVTHCGWNSTLESLTAGVPMVCVPQISDQNTIAEMVHFSWGAGVRAVVDEGDGLLRAAELKRCLDLVSGVGKSESESRKMRSSFWKERARVAMLERGSSYCNLKSFIKQFLM